MRFEILEIVSQDASGVVFQAMDLSSQRLVALMRFFPFGAEGGGFTEEEQEAYVEAVEGLVEVNHPSLRRVVAGGCDPVDGMPYLATEWQGGIPLSERLRGGPLRGSEALQLMIDLADVSIYLSARFGSEVVWVATDLERIVMIDDHGTARFTFSISPVKWLMAEEKRGIEPFVALTEAVMGWQGQVVSDQAGGGLGAWLKWLRRSVATASLDDARLALAKLSANESLPAVPPRAAIADEPQAEFKPQQFLPSRAEQRSPVVVKQPSSRGTWILVALLALIVAGVGTWVWQKKQPPSEAPLSQASSAPQIAPTRAIPPRKISIPLENPSFELPGHGTKIANGFAEVPGWLPNGDHYADSGVEKNKRVSNPEGEWIAFLQTRDDGVYQITDYVVAPGDAIALTWLAGPTSENGVDKAHLVRLFRANDQDERHELAVSLEPAGHHSYLLERHLMTYQTTQEDVGQRIGVEFEVPPDGTEQSAFIGFDDFKLSVTTRASFNAPVEAGEIDETVFQIEDRKEIAELVGQVIDVRGVCRAVWRSASGKSVYLGFSETPRKTELSVFLPALVVAEAKPDFEEQYRDQPLRITGKVVLRNQRLMVEVAAIEQIKVVAGGAKR